MGTTIPVCGIKGRDYMDEMECMYPNITDRNVVLPAAETERMHVLEVVEAETDHIIFLLCIM